MDRAAQEDRILVSSDTDFGTLLALSDETKPSLILFRGEIDSHPERQIALILANLPALSVSLGQGCVAVFEAGRVRIRMLPILGGS
jgi:predicted nuclease of predicted toxin-antitoxin system